LRLGAALAVLVVLAASVAATGSVSAGLPPSGPQATAPPAAPGIVTRISTLTVDGMQRSYLVVAPAGQKAPLPLIVVLHGSSASTGGEVQRDQFEPLVTSGKAILLYPAGYDLSWNADVDNCCGQAGQRHVDDLAFLARVVAGAEATLSVQAGHVDLVGFSNGGKLAYQVMCQEPQLFDAFAVVAATPLAACDTRPQPARSVIVAVGADDPELPISGQAVPATQALGSAAATWRRRDGCSATAAQTASGPATITSWPQCADGTQVRTVLYAGLAHLWPGSQLVGSAASGATLIWQFLSAQRGSEQAG
jgi:polyhydroxybutyrate depolymerase